ncbi:MAG: hypothetical protein IPK79_05400 [Vampirovibrionales bacterium]|nr:hypothetical protein [Vampirovibrionales bacterium]
MSPRLAKKNQPELPQQRTQAGMVGFCPASGLAVTLMREDRCDALMCFKDDASAQALKIAPEWPLAKAAGSGERVNVENRWFNGFSDAFFRGRLPQVIVVTAQTPHRSEFFEEFADYFDKLAALGYLLTRPNPVDALTPCFVLSAEGRWFSAFQDRLALTLKNVTQLDASQRRQVQEKFVRGIFDLPLVDSSAAQIAALRVAGGSSASQLTIQSVLSDKGFAVSLETRSSRPVDRLEMESAMRLLVNRVTPAIARMSGAPAKLATRWRRQMLTSVVAIGCEKGLLKEGPDAQAFESLLSEAPTPPSALIACDHSALEAFAQWAQATKSPQAPLLFQELQQALSQAPSAASAEHAQRARPTPNQS